MRGTLRTLAIALLTLGCTADPVTWGEVTHSDAPPQPAESAKRVAGLTVEGCQGSLRAVVAGESSFAAWWTVRPDSTAVLMTARALRGQPWSAPVIADSTDRGTRGCGRPPASIAADPISGYVHLAYFLEPASGGGVFFAHSMDGGATFHAAVPIVYGKNPARTSVSSHGDRVAVAYEDPNSQQPLVGVALSKTMGHIFEERVLATSDNGRARQPVVRVSGDSLKLWWSEYAANPAISATRPMYRAGQWH